MSRLASTSQSDLAFAGPGALAAAVRAHELSARELVELCLARIDQLDPALNAFRTTLPDEALAAADAIDAGDPADAGPLAGVPFAVKDDLPLRGQPMTLGSRSPATPQERDAEVVRHLREAGAIPIGITNVPELTLFPWTASDANGITRNPWDPTRTPGGSSGGSAAAVAAGMVPAATGTDGGGSLRIPAACCGLVAMKPSRGRVSSRPLGSTWMGMACYGALARTVADSALLLDVVSGTTAEDPYRLPAPDASFADAVRLGPQRPLRVAISTALPLGEHVRLSAEQRLAFERTARLLAELGHEVEPRDPAYGLVSLEYMAALVGGAHDDFEKLADSHLTEPATRQAVAFGRFVTPRLRRWLMQRRPRTTARITALWDDFDVLLTPGLAGTAIAAEGGYGHSALRGLWIASQFMPYYPVFNLTGQPAISLPAGLGADGLPLSIQLVGRIGDEATLYALAGEIEAARPWAFDRPRLADL